jgi:hypothetical protein
MDPIREFITTNEFWDVEGLDIGLIKDSMFQTSKTRMEVLSEGEAIWKVQLQQLKANRKFWFTNHYIAIV